MPAIRISASLVLYKPDLETVERTVLALHQAGQFARIHHDLQLTLTLVDNSDDDAMFGRVTRWFDNIRTRLPDWELDLLQAPGNVGYGRGNNIVIVKAESDYHLVINPDLFVREDALHEALSYMLAHMEVGLLTPAIFGTDGKRQYLCKRNPTLLVMFLRSFAPEWLRSLFRPVLDAFEMRDCDYNKEIHPVEYPTGSFMFFRTSMLKAIGGFDPEIFLHYEDADIGRRMLAIARVNYVPAVVVTHKWARDTHKSMQAMLTTAKSGWYYWRKWGGIIGCSPAKDPALVSECDRVELRRDSSLGRDRLVLVTGANGFIGQAVCSELPYWGFSVLGAVRKLKSPISNTARYIELGEADEYTDWSGTLKGVDSVVHLAARVHIMKDFAIDPLAEYRRVNVAMTMNLAHQAAAAGVRRFIFVSSIKVNGERTPIGQPFTAEDLPHPEDSYGISKLEAERELLKLAEETGLAVVIIRPPLVYGPGVKANFQTMVRWVAKGIPLPFGVLNNRRSLVALDNLTSFIVTCLHHPAAANQTFLVSDGDDLTVKELMQLIAKNFGQNLTLITIPKPILKIAAYVFGKVDYQNRLFNSLQLDIHKNCYLLGWVPPIAPNNAIRSMAMGCAPTIVEG